MTGYVPDVILEAARELRKNMTPAEKELWKHIRRNALWMKFLRQKPLFLYEEQPWLPRYVIPDFCSLEKKIILEVDGAVHTREDVYILDRAKEELLEQKGFIVIRIHNQEIFDTIDIVLEKIVASFP